MLDQYRIEKTRRAVTVRLTGGESIDGAIFVQPSAYRHLGREEPIDLFNSPEPFFPIETSTGAVLLVAKDRVAEVAGIEHWHDDELRRVSARPVTLTVTLVSGQVRTGCIYLEMPTDRPRLLDFLNRCGDRFIALHDEEGDEVSLINARAIEYVHPLD